MDKRRKKNDESWRWNWTSTLLPQQVDQLRVEEIAMALYRDLWEGARNGLVRQSGTRPTNELASIRTQIDKKRHRLGRSK